MNELKELKSKIKTHKMTLDEFRIIDVLYERDNGDLGTFCYDDEKGVLCTSDEVTELVNKIIEKASWSKSAKAKKVSESMQEQDKRLGVMDEIVEKYGSLENAVLELLAKQL